jgi:hypothetical protein
MPSITKILPARPDTTTEQGDVLLELAFLMTAVDGRLADEELTAFGEVVSWLRGAKISDEDFGPLLERFSKNTDKDAIAKRVRELAPQVAPELRELTFRIAMGLALVDDDAAADEDEMMGHLFEHLGLAEDRAEKVAAEVRAAFA